MANVIINDTNLTNIANAIRGKNGLTETYKPSEMAAAITAIPTGGGGGNATLPTELSGAIYLNNGGIWDWYFEAVPSCIINGNGEQAQYAFTDSVLENLSHITIRNIQLSCQYMFEGCKNLKTLPTIYGKNGEVPSYCQQMFRYCYKLREIPEDLFKYEDGSPALDNNGTSLRNIQNMFEECCSLRALPNLSKRMNSTQGYPSTYYNCYVVDEITGIPVTTANLTSNKMSYMFNNCHRARHITFAVQDDGTPYTASWKDQVLDLSVQVGWDASTNSSHTIGYNSGLTVANQYGNSEPAKRDEVDSWTTQYGVSRYGKDSAIETIASLPDTSAYGTNTIKFSGNAGSNTIHGAINTMTEEQIAVATAKGWTVSFV